MDSPNNQAANESKSSCTAELEAKIASLQSELNLLKSNKPPLQSDLYLLRCENELLKVDFANARQCIQIMLGQVEARDEEIAKLRSLLGTTKEKEKEKERENEIDRKGKKVVTIDNTNNKSKGKALIYFTKKGRDEVHVMSYSDSSDNSEGEEEDDDDDDDDDEEEEDVAQLKKILKLGRLDGVGSSSMSNGEVEKSMVLYKIKPWSEGLLSGNDFFPKYLNSYSWGKNLNGYNYKEVPKLMGSSESGSSSGKTDGAPDQTKSNGTTEPHEMKKLNEMEEKLTSKKRKLGVYWGSEEDMLCAMTSSPGILLEAVCALYRQERKIRLCRPKGMKYSHRGLSDSDFQKVASISAVLMEGNLNGPNRKTSEELEEYSKGSLGDCAELVSTYSTQLFHIYSSASDPHFF